MKDMDPPAARLTRDRKLAFPKQALAVPVGLDSPLLKKTPQQKTKVIDAADQIFLKVKQ